MNILVHIGEYALLAFGFGFVIFFHELGHFLAAKYCGVKVEQFAVGFGPAVISWRKGLGFASGTSQHELQKRAEAYLNAQATQREKERATAKSTGAAPATKQYPGDSSAPSDKPPLTDEEEDAQLFRNRAGGWSEKQLSEAATALGISETEYRLNYVPLGGYVKMLGQDDMRPNSDADDPRAYNNKPIRSRMLIVSAGVVMNVILAAIGFMIVFLLGYPAPAAIAGAIVSNSPAMRAVDSNGKPAPLRPGDALLSFDGSPMRDDFTKVLLNVALSKEGKPVKVVVRRHGENYEKDASKLTTQEIFMTPARMDNNAKGFLALGIGQPFELKGPDASAKMNVDEKTVLETTDPDALALMPGDVVAQINGKDVQPQEIWKLFDALSKSNGKSVKLTILTKDHTLVPKEIAPHFEQEFDGGDALDFLGLAPRCAVELIQDKSPVLGIIKPGDVIVSIASGASTDIVRDPDNETLREKLNDAGQSGSTVTFSILSRGATKPHETTPILPSMKLPEHRLGLGVVLGYDGQHTVVADVNKKSPLYGAVQKRDTIVSMNGKPVTNWFEVRQIIADAKAGDEMAIGFVHPDSIKPLKATITLTADEIEQARGLVVAPSGVIDFATMVGNRHTENPVQAIGWGVVETRDLILQFYLTLQRMVSGDLSPSNMMGPVGIFSAGAQFADKGTSWLIWFLAMISANLAVVNFLPIPIVDGGLFTFLVLEKIQGKPLSANTQKIVQVVGLALILGVFLLVTYQDIARIAGS